MADAKISALTDGGTVTATDQIPVNRAGANRRVVVGTAALLASDTDGTLAANSDTRAATQKATKTYSDTKIPKTQLLALATFVFDGAGSAPVAATSTNSKPIPAACVVTGYTITSDVSGSCVIDIQKAAGSGSFSSIVASAAPTLSASGYLDSSTLTGWTTSWAAHDRVKAIVTSASTLTVVTITIYGTLS